jgi:hypothetical protein
MSARVLNEPVGLRASDYESITVSTAVKTLTAAKYVGAKHALITVDANPIRYRLDGTDPEATEGHLVFASATATGVIELNSADQIKRFKAIRQGGADAVLKVTYSEWEV